jgi:opine dehydrogenase
VLGSGAGALTIAAELGLAGVDVTLADFPEFAQGLIPVEASGGIRVICGWHGSTVVPVHATSQDPAAAIRGVPLVIVSVPSFGHEPFARALAPTIADHQTLIWAGEGGGALSMASELRKIGRRLEIRLGETNTLPYGARIRAPGVVAAEKKAGGTLVAGLPTGNGDDVFAIAREIWGWASLAENAWETLLINYNAIDHVATLICNLGTIEGRRGRMLLWGEGATPGVVSVIETVDAELLALRAALGLKDRRRYVDFLVEQGLVDSARASLHDTIHASALSIAPFECGPAALESRYLTEDVPFALVLASSIGLEIAVPTPTIDALVALASAATGVDWKARGRSLATWGLAGLGREGLLQAVEVGSW